MNNILIEPERNSKGACLPDIHGVLIIHQGQFHLDEDGGTRHLYEVRENA